MPIPDDLKPTQNQRVMDLLNSAGIDVSDWANFEGGQERAASNPRYCYEWSFVEHGKLVVLNLWYKSMLESNSIVYQELNFRRPAPEDMTGAAKSTWEKRARKFDEAIQTAAREEIPIRVIVNDGIQRSLQPPGSGASKVKARLLDPVTWAVTAYNWETGLGTISRGASPSVYVDQFSASGNTGEPERRVVNSEAFIRNPDVRRRVLFRARGKCEWCSNNGFEMENGKVYLETHHVIPLSKGGLDLESNVAALCPNHHREAHFGVISQIMREKLLSLIQSLSPSTSTSIVKDDTPQ